MTPERLSRVRTIYEAALEHGPGDRGRFVESACEGDAELRHDVEVLLEARERVPQWLREPVLAPTVPFDEAADRPAGMEGRQLGGYTIVREIGRGGMGTVYLAERSDGAFRKQVAVKLVQPGGNSSEITERFRREREILASLDHPNIARLIDGGATEDGVPYFIMEYVDGEPIHRWCDERKLNITRRLELFRSVCSAVHYAHQRLVVHRDIKPSNILVTADGTVKLLDFGIAKVLVEHGSELLTETRTMVRLMTPEYASPEQVNGAPITTLTDVYSLGVVLYELLTGHRPYHLLSAALHEIARVIAEEEPTRPSVVVTTGDSPITPQAISEVREGNVERLRKRLAGDLDSIALTALRKEPDRRYSSVEAFGDDVRRHLENRPVSAHADSVWYRVNRFVRRHPGGSAAVSVAALVIGASLLSTVWSVRVAIDAGGRTASGRAILAPPVTLFIAFGIGIFAATLYFARANARRITGALAGGVLFAIAWWVRFKIGYAMGWWRSAFADTHDPNALFSGPMMGLIVIIGAAILLLAWRTARRFGWRGNLLFLIAVAVWAAARDRVWWDRLLHVMIAAPGVAPLAADVAQLACGLLIGYGLMRLIAGPARADPLVARQFRT